MLFVSTSLSSLNRFGMEPLADSSMKLSCGVAAGVASAFLPTEEDFFLMERM